MVLGGDRCRCLDVLRSHEPFLRRLGLFALHALPGFRNQLQQPIDLALRSLNQSVLHTR